MLPGMTESPTSRSSAPATAGTTAGAASGTATGFPSATPSAAAPAPSTTAERIADLLRRRAEAAAPLGEAAHQRVRSQGRLAVRDRLDYLLDEGSFVELDEFARHRTHAFGMEKKRPVTDGVVAGWGTIDGREVCVFSQDGTVYGGALGEVYGEKMTKIQELAVATGRPLIGLYEGAGARIQDGVVSLDRIANTFFHNVRASGVVPQISVIMGACAGGNAYSPALTDFVVMVDKTSRMFITGPEVINTVTGENITQEELGGATKHMTIAGNTHFTAASDEEALDWVADLLSYLPSNNRELPPTVEPELDLDDSGVDLDTLIPDSPTTPYDVHDVIAALCDDAEFFEIQEFRAGNVVVGFGRIGGDTVGIVANQPLHLAGCLDIDASEKAARFVRFCDSFNIPILMLVDVPGFLPGADQEHNGILRRGAKLLYAYAEATVPKITVTLRKAYGGAYCVMGSKGLGADLNLAWPTAQIAVMGAAGAVGFLHRREIAALREDKGTQAANAFVAQLEKEYEDYILNPYLAAERGLIDRVIVPSETREELHKALAMLRNKVETKPARKHGNMPL